MMARVVVEVAALVVAVAVNGAAVQVNLKQGVFKGDVLDVGDGRQIHSFRGIPYAKPPVGDLRFMPPEPAEGWQGIKESFAPPQCPQMDLGELIKGEVVVSGDEDCLFLNVYTPKTCGTKLLPVMVFIHGGGFIMGNPDTAGGTAMPLMSRNIVLVSLQYRLGTLGFLSTGDSFLPGNMGLKDQTLALQWVQDNIRSFGGDPDSVTIFGESAGGASVHYQILTPKSQGLFHRAIMQSGNALCPWAFRDDHRRTAVGVGRQLECSGVEASDESLDSQALLSCLQKASVADLVLAATQGETWNGFPFHTVPRVDSEYLPAHPATLLQEGRYNKVDIISGVCQHEGVTIAVGLLGGIPAEMLQKDFTKMGPVSLGLDQDHNGVNLARRVYYHYFGSGNNLTFTKQHFDQLIEMYSNAFFIIPHDLTSQFHARDSTFGKHTYMYQLEHRGATTFAILVNDTLDPIYVGHGDDMQYLFEGVFEFGPIERPDDLFLSDIMMDLWTTFAATGNPTPDLSHGFHWTPATPSSLHYLSLKPAATMRPDPRTEIRAFLTDLPTKQNSLLFPEKHPPKAVTKQDQSESGHCHA